MIKYLELKRINDRYEVEIQQAIKQVLQRGWYLKVMLHLLVLNIV